MPPGRCRRNRSAEGTAARPRRGDDPADGRDRHPDRRGDRPEPGDLDFAAGLITIRRGKGGRGRTIPVGPATIAAIRTYLATRQQQPHADRPELWLGERSCGLAADALYRALRRRAEAAGISGFRPHRLRHTAAHRWLAAGGTESGLMAMAGWTRTDMLVRYTRANPSERAAAEARRLDRGRF